MSDRQIKFPKKEAMPLDKACVTMRGDNSGAIIFSTDRLKKLFNIMKEEEKDGRLKETFYIPFKEVQIIHTN